jgi:Nucleotidyl transferase AbiEii toxin, Type IV TA system
MTEEAKTYKTAGAFRTALETRLQNRPREEGTDLQRLRRQVAFDRFLARMFSKGPKATYPWVLKGGYAMELRTHTARATKDIDLALHDGTRLSKDPKERREQVRATISAPSKLGEYLQLCARSPSLGIPHSTGVFAPVETQIQKR